MSPQQADGRAPAGRDARSSGIMPARGAALALALALVPAWIAGSVLAQVPGARDLPTAPPVAELAPARTQTPESQAGAADSATRSPVAPATDGLTSVIWQLQAYRTKLGLKPAITGNGNGYVAFGENGFRINAGCDTLRGSYWLDDERLLFSPHIASVVSDCPPTLRTQERTVLALLPAVTQMRQSDDELVLLDADARELLTLVRPETAPLQRRVWVLLAYRNRDDTIVPALAKPRFTLRFEDATRLSGVACDEYRGGFVRDQERFLALEGPLTGTRFGCPDPAATRQAEDYLAILGQMDSYRVDAQSLLLRDADGRMIARFAALDPPAEPDDGAALGPSSEPPVPGAMHLPLPAPVGNPSHRGPRIAAQQGELQRDATRIQ